MLLQAFATVSALAAQPLAATPPPPTLVTSGGAPTPKIMLLRPGEARCAGDVARPVFTETPLPVSIPWVPTPLPADMNVRLTFRIDADGRPLSIGEPAAGWIAQQNRDLVPAFAVWRFAPGATRTDCEIAFTAELVAVDAAPMPVLHRLLILGQERGPARQAAWQRTQPPGSTCFSPGPGVRQQNYPAFEQIEQMPGTASYSLVGFDIDASGRPANVRIADSAGNAALDRESVDAIRRSRYAPVAKTGCTYPYWRRATTVIAGPTTPPRGSYDPPGANCPERTGGWVREPVLTFPPEFERRYVEGWAVIGYDVAPWGEFGNVRVLAAEPAARFGSQAVTILSSAREQPGPGATGCTRRFAFRLPAQGEQPPATPRD